MSTSFSLRVELTSGLPLLHMDDWGPRCRTYSLKRVKKPDLHSWSQVPTPLYSHLATARMRTIRDVSRGQFVMPHSVVVRNVRRIKTMLDSFSVRSDHSYLEFFYQKKSCF
jgi:hypothetical protein